MGSMFRSRLFPVDHIERAAVIDTEGTAREIVDPGQHRRRSRAWVDTAADWVADRLPAVVRGRLHIGGRELGLIALAGALALCVTAGLVLRSSAGAAVSNHPTAPVPMAASASPLVRPQGKEVVVDVAGAVVRPGVVTLPAGSRVFEALKAAGGAKPGVETTSLNLARILVDGEQVLVGVAAAPQTGGAASGSSAVSLNRATQAELETLPGVGPVMAANIVSWRTAHGAFSKVEELQEVTGIGPKTFAKLKSLVQL